MTATNHALTGALIGLAIGNSLLAVPAAILSHFLLDAIPHYDFPGDDLTRIRSKGFLYFQILGNAGVCFLLVVLLAIAQPEHWVVAALCAFLATTPDMLKVRKFVRAKRDNVLVKEGWLNRFHGKIQWRVGPSLWWVEALWFTVCCTLLAITI